jgi:DNA-binding SARP family transcriptional activator
MEFRLFGEIQLRAGGQVLDVGTPRQQTVLAALAVDAGRPVPIETLVARVWDEAPPVEARNVLYSHLSRIRQLLKRATGITGVPARLDRRSAGYVLDVDPDLVDLHRFGRLVERAVDARLADADRAAMLTEALGLWRGIPLAGVPGEWVARVRDSWQRRRLDAVVRWGELELAGGRAAELPRRNRGGLRRAGRRHPAPGAPAAAGHRRPGLARAVQPDVHPAGPVRHAAPGT